MTEIWLGVDIGTSGVKVVSIDGDGAVVATETISYPLSTPQPGWVEQRPEDWWNATVEGIRAVLAGRDDQVVAVGLSGQMHGLVALDADHEVIRPAILWNDNRNKAECELILDRVGGLDQLLTMTNNNALPGYTIGKLLWLRDHEPEAYARTTVAINPKDYLRLKLTGDLITDVSDASGFGALDVRARAWSQPLLSALEVPIEMLPPVVESSDITGRVSAQGAQATGLVAGTPVVGGGGDAVVQTTSMGIVSPGPLGVTVGTAGNVTAASERCPDNPQGRLQISCGNSPGRWHVMGVALTTGGALQWWRQALAPLVGDQPAAATLAALAQESPVGAAGLRFLPYLAGERCPHLDPDARGAWTGLDLSHDLRDMSRSIVEGALLNMRQIRDIFTQIGLATDDVRISGGATAHPIWRETLADILGTPVKLVTSGEQGAAYGAALLAGVGTGRWSDLDAALARVEVIDVVAPNPENSQIHDESFAQFERMYGAVSAVLKH